MDERRAIRVAEAVRDELAEIIGYEMDDPRLSSVQIVEVHMSPDGRHAHVRVVAETEEVLEALDHAKGFLRRQLAQRLDLFQTPELRFEFEFAGQNTPRLKHLMKRIRKGRPKQD
jgi:ribosome-binding factor A